MGRIYEGTHAAMLATTDAPVESVWTVTSGTKVGEKYEYRGATAGWVQTHDANGAALVNQAIAAGEDLTNDVIKVEQRFNLTNISTLTTTFVKPSPGFLNCLTINTPVAGSVITLYNNTVGSGAVIATITLPATLLNQGPYTAFYDCVCNVGLTIVTITAASNITVSWR